MTTELEEIIKSYLKDNLKVVIDAKRDWDSNTCYINVQTFIGNEQISYSEAYVDVQDTHVYRG